MTLDDLFAEIARNGWRVSNMYQNDDGLWRVNLHQRVDGGANYGSWAEAWEVSDALFEAMGRMSEAEYKADPVQTYSMDKTPKPSLLSQLGLTKPAVTIQRRI